jgi:ethanolamine utilization protein EutM
MSGQSLGMIETRGFVAAVEALDAGMKAANVHSEGYKVTPSGLVMISFRGDVAAVKTAVSAGVAAARKVGEIVSHHVIPRPDTQLQLKRSPVLKDPSGDPKPETEQSDVSEEPEPDRVVSAEPASTEPSKKSKGTKRSVGKAGASTRKASEKREKKQAQRDGKKSGPK